MKDIGISCSKNSYGRTAGSHMKCKEGDEYEAGLCYEQCPEGMHGVGPVCWSDCPKGWTDCGSLCLEEGHSCASYIETDAKDINKTVVDSMYGLTPKSGFMDFASLTGDFAFPRCDHPLF